MGLDDIARRPISWFLMAAGSFALMHNIATAETPNIRKPAKADVENVSTTNGVEAKAVQAVTTTTLDTSGYRRAFFRDFNNGDPIVPNDSGFGIVVGDLSNDVVSSGCLVMSGPSATRDIFQVSQNFGGSVLFQAVWKGSKVDGLYGISLCNDFSKNKYCTLSFSNDISTGITKFYFWSYDYGTFHPEKIAYFANNNFVLRLIQELDGRTTAWVAQDVSDYNDVKDSQFLQVGHTAMMAPRMVPMVFSSYGPLNLPKKLDKLEVKTLPNNASGWQLYR